MTTNCFKPHPEADSRTTLTGLVIVIMALVLTGCGNKGALYLPDNTPEKTPVTGKAETGRSR